jgi:molybdenum cofactor cytidylyltransferase
MPGVSALILAAGQATRFGAGAEGSKLLAELDGKPLVRHAAEAALQSRAGEVIVVTGHAAEGVRQALGGLDVRFVHNADFAAGMASSLKAGLAALDPWASGVVVLLGDMPRVTGGIIDGLIAHFEADGSAADAVVPVFEGRQGNPVLLGRAVFPALSTLTGDQGARRVLAGPGRRVLAYPIEDAAIEADVDTRDALERLRGGD